MNSAQLFGVVGEVGIHRDHHVVLIGRQHGEKPSRYALPRPCLAARWSTSIRPSSAPMRLCDRSGSVGAVVVDDEHISRRRSLANGAQERLDVLTLVVGRHHDHAAHNGAPIYWAASTVENPHDAEGAGVPGERPSPLERGLPQSEAEPVVEEHPGECVAEIGGSGEHTGDPVDHAAAMATDVGRHGRCTAPRPLGEAQAPTFRERRAGHQPRRAVQRDEVGLVDSSDEPDPGVGVEMSHVSSQGIALGPVTDDGQGSGRRPAGERWPPSR